MGRRGPYIGTGAIFSRTYSEFDFKDFSSGLPEQHNAVPNSIPDQNPFVLDQTFSRIGPLIELRYKVNVGLFSIDLGGFGAYLVDEPIKGSTIWCRSWFGFKVKVENLLSIL
jgi:hypothetical protein